MAKEIKFVERYVVFTCEGACPRSTDSFMRCEKICETFEEAQEWIRTTEPDIYRYHIMKVATMEYVE